jgi:SAM-dependent methyltransferase
MSRPARSATALLAGFALAAPAGVAAQQLEAPPPLAPLAAPPLQPAFASPQEPATLPPGAPLLPPLSAPKPLIELAQTRELERGAQPGPPDPLPGQAGKDVIWLPTPEALVERMLSMAQVTPADVVYDLGSGDGRTVIAAAKRGAEAVGVEFNPDLVALSESRARVQGVARKARFVQGDIFQVDFSRASVVTLYLLSTLNLRLRPTLLKMRPGTRVVSHAFTMEDWPPDEVSRADYRSAYLWIVPAAVEGAWLVELQGGPSFEVELTQRFQRIEGSVGLGGVEAGLREPLLRGDAIRFGFVNQLGVWRELSGNVAGDRMSGTFQAAGRTGRWTAVRR